MSVRRTWNCPACNADESFQTTVNNLVDGAELDTTVCPHCLRELSHEEQRDLLDVAYYTAPEHFRDDVDDHRYHASRGDA